MVAIPTRTVQRLKKAVPGLWFNASEALALLMMPSPLSNLQLGLLGKHVAPLGACEEPRQPAQYG